MVLPPDEPKDRALQGLRGVMAWWVVIGHISLGLGWNLPLIDTNSLAVDVFILLSGYVISLLIERKAEPYGTYLIRRVFRLFPLYLGVLAVSAMLLKVQLTAWESLLPTKANLNRIDLAHEGLANFYGHLAAHIPLLQGIVPKAISPTAAYTIVGQAWSISLEWQFYLVAPFLISAVRDRNWFRAGGIVFLLLLFRTFFLGAFLGAKILLFGVGIATHLAVRLGRYREAAIAGSICALGAIIKDGPLQIVPLAIWAATFAPSIRSGPGLGQIPAKVLGSRVAYYMGEVSYSIYLIHMIPFYVSIYACATWGIKGIPAQIIIAGSTIGLTLLGAIASDVTP